ncbi:hypothetical protein TWF569_011366 [Orbilia oligospora]|uniref:Queuosine 5'-phosphate N-glycosylase/hydrolase n=1 Tax=Orbilia oligospora TaxID=2813651 RepID=A0A7C8P246_ORBOL|nr:hypothetical protein TWF103_011747 [Orbilia oligospora]KAF3093728.1 hypothetical protein TWF706_008640 [Orbilia oligospora]KAF3103960.1 hypothetical protein TWF102_003343 [Orbilia oligospora]KAF3124412.1 hypothetical protein TWF703_000401 [Orbilia oligospora]KAF3138057.1 hypothetical protein TWF594_007314 [Orbilia oligospora]
MTVSDDDTDHDLLDFMRKAMGLTANPTTSKPEPDTGVLKSAEYIYDNAIDVALDMRSCKEAAETIIKCMEAENFGTQTWDSHILHPHTKDEEQVDFIFVMDLLNFSFWADDPKKPFVVEYNGRNEDGYWSLVASLRRALDEGIPITSPYFWVDRTVCTDALLERLFRPSTGTPIPMLAERIECLREAGEILCEQFNGSFVNCIKEADGSAAALVNLVVDEFPCFRDETTFQGRQINFYKRAQILVADIWASFNGASHGTFHDINKITMFADYRIPQILHTLGCLMYSPPLEHTIKDRKPIASGSRYETEIRGCTIHCVELIRREIVKKHPEAKVNAILIDFFLYDTAKEWEVQGKEMIPTHRTRSIWY